MTTHSEILEGRVRRDIRALFVVVALLAATVAGVTTPASGAVDASPAGVVPVEPCVILDTTAAPPGAFAGPLAPGVTLDLSTTNGSASGQGGEVCTIPFGTPFNAVVLSVEAVEVTGAGNLRVFPTGETPTGGVVNYGIPGVSNSNVVIVPVNDLTRQVSLETNVGTVDVVVTLIGYFQPGAGYDYTPAVPCAFADSRSSKGAVGAFVGPYVGSDAMTVELTHTFPADQGGGTTSCDIQLSTELALVNLVALNATGPGRLGVRASGSTDDTTYVHFDPTIPNNSAAVWVPVSAAGTLELFTIADPTVEVDVRAVVLGSADDLGNEITPNSSYVPVTPCTAFDSRSNQGATGLFAGPYDGGEERAFQITGSFDPDQGGGNTSCGVPPGASAVHVNLVALNPIRNGNLRATAAGTVPNGGVVNFGPSGGNNSNAIVVPLSAGGQLAVSSNGGPGVTEPTAEVRGVILGYFTTADQPIGVYVTSPTGDQTLTPSPFFVEGIAYGGGEAIESVELLFRDQLTSDVAFPTGTGISFAPLTFRFDADLGQPGAEVSTFTFGPIDLDAEGSGHYSIEPLVRTTAGTQVVGAFTDVRTIDSPAPTGTIESPIAGAEVDLPFELAGEATAPAGVAWGTVAIRTVDTDEYLFPSPIAGQVTLAPAYSAATELPVAIVGDTWRLLPTANGLLAGRTLEVVQLRLVNNNNVTALIPLSHQFVVGDDDEGPDKVRILTPSDGSFPSPPMLVSGTASDSSGVEEVRLTIVNTATGEYWTSASTWSTTPSTVVAELDTPNFPSVAWSWSDPALSRVAVEITATGFDLYGNSTTTPTPVSVTITS